MIGFVLYIACEFKDGAGGGGGDVDNQRRQIVSATVCIAVEDVQFLRLYKLLTSSSKNFKSANMIYFDKKKRDYIIFLYKIDVTVLKNANFLLQM
jgi:hypothetical protein